MNKAYLGLGSNMGDKKRYLYDAIQILNHHEQIMITTLSSLYETVPWGYVDQDIFMNLVVEIETTLAPIELLDVCQQIENELGRVREFKWGPRVIDVDILIYNDEAIECERLIVPHPYMTERDFVMIPLAEICPQLVVKEKKVQDWAQNFNQEALKIISSKEKGSQGFFFCVFDLNSPIFYVKEMFLIHHLHGWRLYFIYTDDCYLVNKWSYVKKELSFMRKFF